MRTQNLPAPAGATRLRAAAPRIRGRGGLLLLVVWCQIGGVVSGAVLGMVGLEGFVGFVVVVVMIIALWGAGCGGCGDCRDSPHVWMVVVCHLFPA